MPAKQFVSKIIEQAKDPKRLLELAKLPSLDDRRKLTNERILASLKRVGVATQSEVDSLKEEIQALRSELRALKGEKDAKEQKGNRARASAHSPGQSPT